MKAVCLQENLKSALNIASRNVASRPQLPILSHIFLKAEKNKIRISATNLSQGINLWLNAKIEKQGKITVPAKIVSEFISSLPAGKLQLEAKKDQLLISSSKFKASFNGLPASEFPPLVTIDEVKKKKKETISLALTLKDFWQAVNQTAFAAAADESRPVLAGVLWKIEKEEVALVATDGYRLGIRKLKLKLPEKIQKTELIVPASSLLEASRLGAEKETMEMLIVPGGKQIIFGLDDIEITCQLLQGEYPDFEKIIPQEGETKAVLDREEFLQAVQTAAIFARESANIIKFKIQSGAGESTLKVSANAPQIGENESILAAKITGKDDKIAFNSRFVLDFLKSIEAEEVEIEMSSPTSPAIFRPVKDKAYRHIIMPVRVQEEAS